jgi:cobalt-zinc-cadmium efflux system protein
MSDNHHHNKLNGNRLGITVFLNILITVAQFIGGIASGSMSLLSDALHNFSDVIALIVTYAANRMAQWPFSEKQTFGYQRAEIVATLINATSLLIIAGFLIKESISGLITPTEVSPNLVIWLAAFSIVMNGVSVLILKKESESSLNIRSATLHLFTDMLTSVAVLLGGIAMAIWEVFWVDKLLSIGISLYLIISSWGLLKESLQILMQFTPDSISVSKVEEVVETFSEISTIHHIHLWELTDSEIHLEAHLDFVENISLKRVTEILEKLRTELIERCGLTHITLQPEIGTVDCKEIIVDERKE